MSGAYGLMIHFRITRSHTKRLLVCHLTGWYMMSLVIFRWNLNIKYGGLWNNITWRWMPLANTLRSNCKNSRKFGTMPMRIHESIRKRLRPFMINRFWERTLKLDIKFCYSIMALSCFQVNYILDGLGLCFY